MKAPPQEKQTRQFDAVQSAPDRQPMRGVGFVDNRPAALAQPAQAMWEAPVQLAQAPAAKPNNTVLPDKLKFGIESMSGMSMDHVNVHCNPSQPTQLNAHAYAQGSDIHVQPGAEKHLPHEAWHVVQQAQGRVRPTMQMEGGVSVNDDVALENEADAMGIKAVNTQRRRQQ